MREKLAIEPRPAYALEGAGRALPAPKSSAGPVQAPRQCDRISISALAHAIASPETATRLSELAAAVEARRYAIEALALSRRVLAEHILPAP